MSVRTIETHPDDEVIGHFFNGADGQIYLCDSHDPRCGYWMTRADDPVRRANISERAVGRTYHELRPKALAELLDDKRRQVLVCPGDGLATRRGFDVLHAGFAISRLTEDGGPDFATILIPADPKPVEGAAGQFTFMEEPAERIVVTMTLDSDGWTVRGDDVTIASGEKLEPALSAAIAQARHLHSEQDHRDTLQSTGFWGQRGAGCVIVARDTGRVLLPLRSEDVEQPGTWGTWGGAINLEITPEEAVAQEVREEAGYDGAFELIPAYVFEAPSGSFRYFNFIAIVETEFQPELNWETERSEWFTAGEWPEPLHFGLKSLLDDEDSLSSIMAGGRAPIVT